MILDNYNPFKKHILEDKKKRVVYYDYRTKTAYYLTDAVMGKYRMYSNRWIIAIAFAVLAGGLFLEVKLAILAGVFIGAGLFITFKRKFLPSLSRKENVNVEDLFDKSMDLVKNEPFAKSVFRIGLYIAFSILLVLNAYDQKMDVDNLPIFYMSWGLAVGSLVVAIYNIYQLITKKQA